MSKAKVNKKAKAAHLKAGGNNDIQDEFSRRRISHVMVLVPVIITLVFIIFVSLLDSSSTGSTSSRLIIASAFIMLVFIAFLLFNWRCPSCVGYLGYGVNPCFCPQCGVRLR